MKKRYVRLELGMKDISLYLSLFFSMNLLARRIERRLSHLYSQCNVKYSRFAPATLLALREYNNNQSSFVVDVEPLVFLKDLVYELNEKVNEHCRTHQCIPDMGTLIHSNTSIGVELEFSNKGHTAGKFFCVRQR